MKNVSEMFHRYVDDRGSCSVELEGVSLQRVD